MRRRRLAVGLCLVVVGVALLGWYVLPGMDPGPRERYTAARRQLDTLVVQWVVPPSADRYQRSAYGKGWASIHGCDARNRVLARDLVDVQLRPGTQGCVVEAGQLHDPYTGRDIPFRKGGDLVDIDHRYPLHRAWDYGARDWPSERRQAFANDLGNLRAVSASANRSKGDSGPATWQPRRHRCDYLADYVEVATRWQLAVSPADYLVSRVELDACRVL